MSYGYKYLKYKSKYLALKNQLGSGEKTAKDIFVKAYARIPEEVSKILNNDKRFLTFKDIPTELDSIFDQIWTITGKDKSTIDWIIKSYVNNNFGVPSSLENLGRFKDNIKKYSVLHTNLDGIKPIHEIEGLLELERFIDSNEDNFKKIEEKKSKQKNKVELQKKIKEEGEDDKEVLLETDKIIIYKPTTEKGSRYYGRNTTWCTTASENSQFNYYNSFGPLYIIQSKSDYKDKYQLHLERNQFMDNKDAPVKIDYVKTHFNDDGLNEWFDNIFKTCKSIQVTGNKMEPFSFKDLHKLINLTTLNLGLYFDHKLDNYLDKLTKLQTLHLGSLFNQQLGHSLYKLTNLQTLTFSESFNQPLGNSLNKLTNLQTLNFNYKFNQPLGNSLDKLTNLQTLTFSESFNQPLGNSLDKLTNLQTLNFKFFFNQQLGNSLDKLTNLKNLTFGLNFNQPLGNSLDKLTNLQTLDLSFSFNQPFGNSLDKLTNLQTLKFGEIFNKPLGNSLDKLTNLKTLNNKPYVKN